MRLLPPTGAMVDRTPDLYRAHCRELIERVAVGRDLPRVRAADFWAGLERFLAMFVLLVGRLAGRRGSIVPKVGAFGKTSNHNITLR